MINILLPLDGSVVAEEAVKHALRIARTFPARLTVLRVIHGSDRSGPVQADSVDIALLRHQAQAYFRGLLAKYDIDPDQVDFLVLDGSPAESVVNYLHEAKPDLLVLTRFGRGNASEFAAGGTAQKIVSRANCSILLLDPRERIDSRTPYGRLLVPVDDSRASDAAVAIASMMAKVNETSLVLLQVVAEPTLPKGLPNTRYARELVSEMHGLILQEARRRLQDLAATLPPEIAVDTRTVVAPDASLVIESVAEDENCDMLVLHTEGQGLDVKGTERRHRFEEVNQSLLLFSRRPLLLLQPVLEEGVSSRFRCVFLDEQRLQAG
ncbi:MAG: universal stress protein [Chromatiales bacterium]|nr:universal stress protein [Chromatiales bacterium]